MYVCVCVLLLKQTVDRESGGGWVTQPLRATLLCHTQTKPSPPPNVLLRESPSARLVSAGERGWEFGRGGRGAAVGGHAAGRRRRGGLWRAKVRQRTAPIYLQSQR